MLYTYAIIIFFEKAHGPKSLIIHHKVCELWNYRARKRTVGKTSLDHRFCCATLFVANVTERCFLPYLRFWQWVTRVSGGYLFTRSADAAAHLCVLTVIYSNVTPNEKCQRLYYIDNFDKQQIIYKELFDTCRLNTYIHLPQEYK